MIEKLEIGGKKNTNHLENIRMCDFSVSFSSKFQVRYNYIINEAYDMTE